MLRQSREHLRRLCRHSTTRRPIAAMPLSAVALFAWAATSSTPAVSSPLTINVRDFGALGDGEDACFAFNQSIEAARATNATEIYIPHGTYHFYWHSCGQWAPLIYVSNTVITPLPPKPIALWLRGLHDLVVDGDGSTLLMHGLMTPIAIDHRQVAYYSPPPLLARTPRRK